MPAAGNVELRLWGGLGTEALELQIPLGKPPRSNVENFNADQIFYALTEVEQPPSGSLLRVLSRNSAHPD